MSSCVNKVELGIVSNKLNKDVFIFSIYRRSIIINFDDNMIPIEKQTGRWYKVRGDNVLYSNIGSYIKKCKDASVIDINDNIL